MRGVVLAGTHSGCGKTTVTLGLLAALTKKGLAVQAFKAGPDFIDSGLHRLITGRASRNLDLWMCGEEYVRECFARNMEGADIAVVEGVMGLYDGTMSTAVLAATLGLPVILIIDAYGMAESAAAVVEGFVSHAGHMSAPPDFAGVIFNRIASERHYRRIRERVTDIPVLGYLPRDLGFQIPHRHLGLTVAEEGPISAENMERLGEAVLEHVDVDRVAAHYLREVPHSGEEAPGLILNDSPAVSIAVAYDRAFCFYYEDNLDLLRDRGAKIIRFSPIADRVIPEEADAVYIGGGYPELYAGALQRNLPMRESVNNWARAGRPLYAECGGLMYLSKGIHDFDGSYFEMCGVFDFKTEMTKGCSRLGYREVRLTGDCILGKRGERIRGHEFHYSTIRGSEPDGIAVPGIYYVVNGSGDPVSEEGYALKKTLGSYIHLHFGSNPGVARSFVEYARKGGR